MKWVEISQAVDNVEAQVIKSFLEANNIKVILSQENFSNSFGLINQQLPEIAILVAPENLEAAKNLLKENSEK
jgi:hypothetical protein